MVSFHDLASNSEELEQVFFRRCLMDEAMAVWNDQTKLSRVWRRINSASKVLMSATPTGANVPRDLKGLVAALGFTKPLVHEATLARLFASPEKLDALFCVVGERLMARFKELNLMPLHPNVSLKFK